MTPELSLRQRQGWEAGVVLIMALLLTGCALVRHPLINPSTGTTQWPQATDLQANIPNVPR